MVKLLLMLSCLNMTTRPVASLLLRTANLQPRNENLSGARAAISHGKRRSFSRCSGALNDDVTPLRFSFKLQPYMKTFCLRLWP